LQHSNCGATRQFVRVIVLWSVFLLTDTLHPLFVHAQATAATPSGTTIIPSFGINERYDTNIYMAPSNLLPPGTKVNDFVTALQGNLKVLHKDKDVEASLLGGVDGNLYAYSPGLNYISTRVDTFADLKGLAERLVKGAQFAVYDYFRYTPTSPGFLTGGKAGTEDPFLRGIQSFRANTFSNTLTANAMFPLYKDFGVEGKYSFALYRVGSILAATSTGATFFDTTVHTWSAGPRLRLGRVDSIALLYQQSLINQTIAQSNGAGAANTNTQSVTANFDRVTPNWRIGVQGGVTLIEPASKAFPTGRLRISNSPERLTTVQLELSRQAAPSFYLVAGAMISNVAQVQITYRMTKLLTLRGSVG
jgi:hypothetical protein